LITPEFLRYLESQVDGWLYLAERNRDTLVEAGLRTGHFQESFNAVDAGHIIWENRYEFRERHGVVEDAFALVVCSRAIRSKGWETAALITKILNARQPTPVHLFLIGEGPDLDDLKREHGDAPGIHFLGHVDQPARLLRCFDLSIFPSTYVGESFPLFLLESMAAGLPIVSTDNGNISSLVVPDGVRAGSLVSCNLGMQAMAEEMASLVARYMVDRNLYERSRENALRNSNRYSLASLTAHYLAFFEDRMLDQAHLNDMTG
jgi:glycosyltransferase involved in cell wall biosynthesis